MTSTEREALIRGAVARVIFEGYVGAREGFDKRAFAYDREKAERVADRALRAVFEEAYAPTDSERETLVSAVDAQSLRMLIDDVDEGAFPDQGEGWFNIVIEEREQLVRRIVEWVQDRDCRRPVQAEPTDSERGAIIDALLDELGWDWEAVPEEHIPSSREILGDMADRVLAVLADGFRRPVQGEPTDIQVRAAAKAINVAGWTAEGGEHEPGCFCGDCERVCTPVALAALRAAAAATQEGENRG